MEPASLQQLGSGLTVDVITIALETLASMNSDEGSAPGSRGEPESRFVRETDPEVLAAFRDNSG